MAIAKFYSKGKVDDLLDSKTTLTPIYSDTPTFSEWTFSGESAGTMRHWVAQWDLDHDCWALYSVSDSDPYDRVSVAPAYGSLSDTTLHFSDGGTEVTATRTRTDIIGYRLGSQADKPIASEAEAEALRTALAGKMPSTATGADIPVDATQGAQKIAAALAGKVPTSRTVNAKALTGDVTLTANDIDYSVSGGAQSVQMALEGIDAALAEKLDKSGGEINGSLSVTGEISIGDESPATFTKEEDAVVIHTSPSPEEPVDVRIPLARGDVATLMDILGVVRQIAPAWVSGTAYATNALVSYNGVVYRCKLNTVSPHTATPDTDATHWEARKISELFLPLTGGEVFSSGGTLDVRNAGPDGVARIRALSPGRTFWTGIATDGFIKHKSNGNEFYYLLPDAGGTLALLSNTMRFSTTVSYDVGAVVFYNGAFYRCKAEHTAGAWNASHFEEVIGGLSTGTPTAPTAAAGTNTTQVATTAFVQTAMSGIAAGDLLTIVTLADSTETMASILARLNAINAAHQHVFFDCSGIDVNPRLYLCTIMIDADANAVRVYDQVTGKLYIGPYDATETIGEVFAKAVDAYHSITVSAVTLDGATVTGQTVTIHEGTDATAPVYATATITDGAPVTFVVPKGMIYFLEITDTLADHFGPRVTSGARQGIATADAAVTFTYYDAEHIDVSEITTFAKLQEALTWFGTNNEVAARNNLVGIEIADTWTATNGTVYDNPRVVWDVHYFEDENGVSHLGALMGTKYCSYNDMQFDAAEGEECDSSTETVAEADVYYYGLALGQTSKTAANLTLLELSTGGTLPYADYAKIYKSAIRDTTRSSLQYGYNNWRDSAYRQYLNSDAATGQWWGATHIGDVAPSQLSSVRGFMAGCSAALLAAAKKVKVATWPNYITDGPNQITTLYETLDTFFLPSGSEVYGDVNRNGGASVEGALSPYWQARTGYTSPNNTATSTRSIYRELPVGSTASRSAAGVRLRSAYRGNSGNVWVVGTSGQVITNSANNALASVPACVIY